MLTIAIVGLPNVGKSTFFNRLMGRKLAIVNDVPGVTRDRREGIGKISDAHFKMIDTGGLDKETAFFKAINEQVKLAINVANIIFFIVDAREIVNQNSKNFAAWVRKVAHNKPVILLANKAENKTKSFEIDEFEHLKFIGPVYISAEHNLGLIDLYDALRPFIPENPETDEDDHNPNRAKIAIVGRPNVGKSTLVNSLLQKNRMIVSDNAGTTRDSIDTTYFYNDREILLIDTAGIRKKSNVTDTLEVISVKDSIDSIRRSNIAILIIDATLGIENQDLAIAEIAITEGKGLIIALNKWDLINSEHKTSIIKMIKQEQLKRLGFEAPVITISALNNVNCNELIEKSLYINTLLRTKISTSKLNKWLIEAVEFHKPPSYKSRSIRFKYITQIGTLPPSFLIMCNFPDYIDKNYIQYLVNSCKKCFSFNGVPIKLTFKKNKNPYNETRTAEVRHYSR